VLLKAYVENQTASALFWDVMQLIVVILYGRFDTGTEESVRKSADLRTLSVRRLKTRREDE
jgi:hypothetical protein